MQIHRLFEIVYILLQKRHTTAKELAQRFEVSTRTIYRDLDILSMAGIPLYTNKGSNGGIFLMEEYTMTRSLLNDEEQQHVLSALQSYQMTNQEDTQALLTKLSAQFHKEQINWIDVDFSNWSGEMEDDKTFHLIKQAIFNHTCIHVIYYNSCGQKSNRDIEPFRLFFKGQSWYLIGFCLEKKQQRMFKLHRMKQLTQTNQSIQHTIDEQQLVTSAQHMRQDMVHIIARIAPSHAFRVYDEYTPEHYEILENGFIRLHISFPRGEWVFGYLMGFGDALRVIEPQDIKKELIKRYQHALTLYEKGDSIHGS